MSGSVARRFILCAVLAVLLVLPTAEAVATSHDSAISGRVVGSDGVPIPGVTIAVSELKGQDYKPVTTLDGDSNGTWYYSCRPGEYRFDFSAGGYDQASRELETVKDGIYTLDVTLASPSGSVGGAVVSGAARTPLSGAFVWLYKQNADGTWPATSPGWGSPTYSLTAGVDGTYSAGSLPYGHYKVRFFTVHTGSQWWQYVLSADAATVLTVDGNQPDHTGIDGWFNQP